MEPVLLIMLMTLPALVTSMVVALNAKRLNAAMREKRLARRAQRTKPVTEVTA